jgi:hypothetical protein
MVLRENGPLRAGDLARQLNMTTPGQTRLVDSLIQHGLVARTRDPFNRRMVVVALTPKGEAWIDDVPAGRRPPYPRTRENVRGSLPEPIEDVGHTVEEAAAQLGIRPEMIYKAMRLGNLPRRPHPNPPTHRTRWILTDDDLDAYRRQHRRGRRPAVLDAPPK